MSFKYLVLILMFLQITATVDVENGYCDAEGSCNAEEEIPSEKAEKLLFYDVNPPEGFNLRRDVYMRFAILMSNARKSGKHGVWRLVLPPWHRMYHWRSTGYNTKPVPWQEFFDLNSLKSFAPVTELHEILAENLSKPLLIDTVYVLQNYDNPFEGGMFVDKWEINNEEDCEYDGNYWGHNNVMAKEVVCVRFQGKISKIWELINLHRNDKKIMFAHGEIPLHDNYGTKEYWDCRKSMKFNEKLVKAAEEFIEKNLGCNTMLCDSYISIHWRRQDFVTSRKDIVPSLHGTVRQIHSTAKKLNLNNIFISTDASINELKKLETELLKLNHSVYYYKPDKADLGIYKDGGIAIIDQIISSRAAYFVGTHESTFSFRIHEEREILGFDSDTTFNRLCPDSGECEDTSRWTLVN